MRHLDRRTRVAVAAALLAPAVLLSGATTAHAVAGDDNPNAGWWDSSGSFDKSQRDSEPRARDRDGSGQSDFDSDDDDEWMQEESRRPDTSASDEAARRFANDPGFSNSRPEPNSNPANDDPGDGSSGMPSPQVDNTAPGHDEDSGSRDAGAGVDDGAGSGDTVPSEEDAKAAREEFSVEKPKQKSFDEGMARVKRGRNSDIPKSVDKAEKSEKPTAKGKSAKPRMKSKGKPKPARR